MIHTGFAPSLNDLLYTTAAPALVGFAKRESAAAGIASAQDSPASAPARS
jgi:hypothetical protein